MNGRCTIVLVALAAGACGSTDAHAQPAGDDKANTEIRSQALKRLIGQIKLVDPGLFVNRPPMLRMEVETMMPAVVNGQIPSFGGPLQTYLNLAGQDVMRDAHLPFGATGVLPINRWRLEVFGGIGGVYAPFRTSYAMTNAWMIQTSMGARVALDQGRHVWVGTTARYVTDFADKKRQWVTGTADLTVRFGK